jgi:glucose-6-phosphate 1-dehydrogenase
MDSTISIVIFGASGDLTERKLIPALFSLYSKGRLPPGALILGMARTEMSDEIFRTDMQRAMEEYAPDVLKEGDWSGFSKRLGYVSGDFKERKDMDELVERLAQVENGSEGNRLYYLATPPFVYEQALERLGDLDMVREDHGWRRVVIEKPFGHDLESARQLNQAAHEVLEENQIYRIDHYLGKETVQNVLVFRFANSIFEPIWNRNYIDHVQITVAESVGVGHRARFYDGVGVLRDMFQNHLMQVLALIAMEPPASFGADHIRNERVKVLSSLRPMSAEEIRAHSVLAQYEGYREVEGVAEGSRTPTYAALKLYIDNWRWKDVPFYLRSGKFLSRKTTEVRIQFRTVPHMMFPMPEGETIRPNALSICIQPDEGIHLRFEAKVPDEPAKMRSVDMEFHYSDAFGMGAIPEAYERLLLDAINGDPSLFTRADTIEHAWGFVDSIIHSWDQDGAPDLADYASGSWGPSTADEMLKMEGRQWQLGCAHG